MHYITSYSTQIQNTDLCYLINKILTNRKFIAALIVSNFCNLCVVQGQVGGSDMVSREGR